MAVYSRYYLMQWMKMIWNWLMSFLRAETHFDKKKKGIEVIVLVRNVENGWQDSNQIKSNQKIFIAPEQKITQTNYINDICILHEKVNRKT